jgi:hypothetical protein
MICIYSDLTVVLKIEKDIVKLPQTVEYDKATTWLLCSSYSLCLHLLRHSKLHRRKQALTSALYVQSLEQD